ncbi:MAG: hypothetical protein EU529_01915 [Promethearchaeota archaeon]|nr:MAG: hypothetical protein EU529_01915 [Candidatus Lokiarchaeota archaeon]
MLFLEFPISGDIRLPLLIMEWIFIITGFEISLIFLVRYFKQEKTLRNLQDVGYFSLFFGFSLMWCFYIIGNYFVEDDIISPFLIWRSGSARAFFLNLGYFTMIFFTTIFLFCVEKYIVFIFKRYVFTTIFSICAIIFLILFFIDIRITQAVTYIYWLSFSSFFVIYLIKFMKKLEKNRIFFFSGLLLMVFGFALTTDVAITIFGLEGRMIGSILQLFSVVILSYFFLTLPPFSEFDWQDKIEALFLVNSAGICIYYKVFSERKDLMDENLISAAITSINIMLRELSETGEERNAISVLQKKGENVIIYQAKNVSGILYTSEELNFPKVVLKYFVDKFETLYHNILLVWDGATDIFKPAEIMANDLFCK